jgi:hypothetical protein
MSAIQVYSLTEEEHLDLVDVGDSFWHAFGKLAAEHIQKMPPQLRDVTTQYLQEKSSIYGSRYDEFLMGDYKTPDVGELFAKYSKK